MHGFPEVGDHLLRESASNGRPSPGAAARRRERSSGLKNAGAKGGKRARHPNNIAVKLEADPLLEPYGHLVRHHGKPRHHPTKEYSTS